MFKSSQAEWKTLLRRDQDIKDPEGGEVSKSVLRCWCLGEHDTKKRKEKENLSHGKDTAGMGVHRWSADIEKEISGLCFCSMKMNEALLRLLQIDTNTCLKQRNKYTFVEYVTKMCGDQCCKEQKKSLGVGRS